MSKTAVSYIRFSSARQLKGDSLARQTELLGKWATDNPDYTVSERSFRDLGISGWSETNGHLDNAFGRLLEAIEAGIYKPGTVILIEDITRAGRQDTAKMLHVLTGILLAGVSIITLADGVVYDRKSLDGGHIYLLSSKIQAAHDHSQQLSNKMKGSYTRKAERAASGETIKRNTPMWLTSDGQLIKKLAPYIKSVFEDYAAGIGERRIVRRLRETGLPEFANVAGPGIRKWLKNRTAMGYWGYIPDVYPPVVDKELFYRVELKMTANKEKKRTAPTRYLLTGLVKCGHCGANMNMHKYLGRAHSMGCHSRNTLLHLGCDNSRTIPKDVLEHIRVRTSLPFVERAFQQQQLSVSQKRVVEIEGALEDVSKRIKGLMAGLERMGGDMPEIFAQLSARKAEREALELERTLLTQTESPLNQLGIVSIEHDMLESDPMKLNALLQGAGYTITCYADGLILVSEERYPWLYMGFSRKEGKYQIKHLDETIGITLLSPEMRAKLDQLKADREPTPSMEELNAVSPLLALIRRQHRANENS